MIRRYALPLVIAGTAGLLVGLVVLWKSIGSETAPPQVEATTRPQATSPGATVTPPSSTPGGPATARAPLPPAIQSRSPEAPPTVEGSPAAASGSDSAPPGTRLNTKNLEFGLPQMRAQAAAVEPKVRECLSKAAASGSKPTGDATVTFIAAKKGDKIVIEDTSVDPEQTTLKGDALLDCLHETSKAMTFQGLPREAEAVMVTRSIKVANGQLVENGVVKFSYIH